MELWKKRLISFVILLMVVGLVADELVTFPWDIIIALLCFVLLVKVLAYDEDIEKVKIPILSTSQDEDVKIQDSEKSGKRICLVVGASGFAGRYFVEYLIKDGRYDVVRAMDVVEPKFVHSKIENVQGDITKLNAILPHFSNVETVFHFASFISMSRAPSHWNRSMLVNVLGCRNVLDASIRKGVKKMIYLSSQSAFTDFSSFPLRDEEEAEKYPPRMDWCYAVTKRKADELVRKASGIAGLRTICLRPAVLYGEGAGSLFINTFTKKLPIFNGDHAFHICYLGNLSVWLLAADAALETCPEKVSGKGYFVGDEPEAPTFNDVTKFLSETFKIERKFIPKPIAFGVAYLGTVFDWYTNGSFSNVPTDIALLSGYAPTSFTCRNGFRDLSFRPQFSREDITRALREFFKVT